MVDGKPAVADVSLLMRTRTVAGVSGGLGSDTGADEVTEFDDSTRPSATEVESLIDTSFGAMKARLPIDFGLLPEFLDEAFSHVVALYTAVLIETSYFREQANQVLLDLWRSMINDELAGIVTSVERQVSVATSGFGSLAVTTTLAGQKRSGEGEPALLPGTDWDEPGTGP